MLLERKKDAVSTGNTARSRPWRSLRGGRENQRAKAEAADFSVDKRSDQRAGAGRRYALQKHNIV